MENGRLDATSAPAGTEGGTEVGSGGPNAINPLARVIYGKRADDEVFALITIETRSLWSPAFIVESSKA